MRVRLHRLRQWKPKVRPQVSIHLLKKLRKGVVRSPLIAGYWFSRELDSELENIGKSYTFCGGFQDAHGRVESLLSQVSVVCAYMNNVLGVCLKSVDRCRPVVGLCLNPVRWIPILGFLDVRELIAIDRTAGRGRFAPAEQDMRAILADQLYIRRARIYGEMEHGEVKHKLEVWWSAKSDSFTARKPKD